MVPSYRCDVVDYKIKDLCTAGFGVQDYNEWKIHSIGDVGYYKPEPFDLVRLHDKLPFMKVFRDTAPCKYWMSCTDMKVGDMKCKYMGEGVDFVIVMPIGYMVTDIYASAVLAHASEKTMEVRPEMNFTEYLLSIKDKI